MDVEEEGDYIYYILYIPMCYDYIVTTRMTPALRIRLAVLGQTGSCFFMSLCPFFGGWWWWGVGGI